MADSNQDIDERENRRLHFELEQAIRTINRELIGATAGQISKSRFESCARMVACLRARYLEKVLQLGAMCGDACISTDEALELKQLREAYDEALQGFSALEHALNRGYIDLARNN
ncbi:MAG: hypothetical protein H6978_13610 [Gammaproteobacteria bacterium]|nr:hypothetical protein [Gammaproteobacteria bacterium]